jgi:hypothetical protein
VARPKRVIPKSLRHEPTLDELEAMETADWAHDCQERERKQTLKYKRAANLSEAFDKKKKRR